MTNPIETVQAFYDALGRADAPAALGLLTPDMERRVVAGWPYKPAGRGPRQTVDTAPVLEARS